MEISISYNVFRGLSAAEIMEFLMPHILASYEITFNTVDLELKRRIEDSTFDFNNRQSS